MENTFTIVGELKGEEFVIANDASFQEAIELSIDHDPFYDAIHIREEHDIIKRHKNLMIISDTHGLLLETKLMIEDRPLELDEQIVFLGNFISKDEPFLPYMEYLIDLKSRRSCVFVLGQTEYNLLSYINQSHKYLGSENEVMDLIAAIEAECDFLLTDLRKQMPGVYAIFSEAVNYYETDSYIFVSGGLDLSLDSWRQSKPVDMFKTSPEFLMAKNKTGKTIVFGTTPVKHLNTDEQVRPWIVRSENKIGINGDVANYQKLLALLVHGDDRCFIGIRHQATRNVAEAYIGNDQLLFGSVL